MPIPLIVKMDAFHGSYSSISAPRFHFLDIHWNSAKSMAKYKYSTILLFFTSFIMLSPMQFKVFMFLIGFIAALPIPADIQSEMINMKREEPPQDSNRYQIYDGTATSANGTDIEYHEIQQKSAVDKTNAASTIQPKVNGSISDPSSTEQNVKKNLIPRRIYIDNAAHPSNDSDDEESIQSEQKIKRREIKNHHVIHKRDVERLGSSATELLKKREYLAKPHMLTEEYYNI